MITTLDRVRSAKRIMSPSALTHTASVVALCAALLSATISTASAKTASLRTVFEAPRIPAQMRAVFQRGKKLGNRPAVFSKIGDSLSAVPYVMYPIGYGRFNLHDDPARGALQRTADYFRAQAVGGVANAFLQPSQAARAGWTSADALDPAKADPAHCAPGEAPLRCEYRLTRPSVALILFGTNDVSTLTPAAYRANMTQIVTTTLAAGIIPVLSTLPPRMQFEGEIGVYNQILRELASRYTVPLSDYGAAMRSLPNYGLSEDGVHPSWPPGEFSLSADFSDTNLTFGYTARNYMILQSLDAVRRQVMR
jgi:hypothetical protein